MSAKAIPDGYPVLTPYLIIDGAAAAIDFYTSVFGAVERMRMDAPGGKVGHAELLIDGCLLMLADEFLAIGARGPMSIGGSPVQLHVYVKDVDAVFTRAIDAGAKVQQPLETKFYGDRSGSVVDPFGHIWHIATHVEDVSPEEVQRRAAAIQPPK